jgi:hypothetical protein
MIMPTIRRVLLAVLLILGLAVATQVQPVEASPQRQETATTLGEVAVASSYGSDICAVLKTEFDPQNTAYYTYRYRVQIVFGPTSPAGTEQDAWVFCLWVPKVSPNYGSLCGLYIGHLYPGPQYTHYTDSPNPRWPDASHSQEDATCP